MDLQARFHPEAPGGQFLPGVPAGQRDPGDRWARSHLAVLADRQALADLQDRFRPEVPEDRWGLESLQRPGDRQVREHRPVPAHPGDPVHPPVPADRSIPLDRGCLAVLADPAVQPGLWDLADPEALGVREDIRHSSTVPDCCSHLRGTVCRNCRQTGQRSLFRRNCIWAIQSLLFFDRYSICRREKFATVCLLKSK